MDGKYEVFGDPELDVDYRQQHRVIAFHGGTDGYKPYGYYDGGELKSMVFRIKVFLCEIEYVNCVGKIFTLSVGRILN